MVKVTDPCPSCNGNHLCEDIFTEKQRETTIHFGKLYCAKCNKFIRWLSKDEIEGRHKRIKKRILKDIKYCEICLKSNIVINEHHILPFEIYPELDDDQGNRLVVCTSCHSIIHGIRKIAGTDRKKIKGPKTDEVVQAV